MKFNGVLVLVILISPMISNARQDSVSLFLEHLKRISSVCETQVGITKEVINALVIGNFQVDQPMPVYCYISCVAKNLGLLNADDTFNEKEMAELFTFMKDLEESSYGIDQPISKIEYAMNICLQNQRPGDPCEIVKKLAECVDSTMKIVKK